MFRIYNLCFCCSRCHVCRHVLSSCNDFDREHQQRCGESSDCADDRRRERRGQPPLERRRFVLNDAMTSMTMQVTIFNIDFTGTQTADVNDNLTAAHIHASPTATTVNAPVVWGFFGSPFNDNNPNDVVVTPFATGVGGTITGKWDAPEGNGTTLAAQLPNILSGNSYINFHTTQFRCRRDEGIPGGGSGAFHQLADELRVRRA